jgi:hypothetical protein
MTTQLVEVFQFQNQNQRIRFRPLAEEKTMSALIRVVFACPSCRLTFETLQVNAKNRPGRFECECGATVHTWTGQRYDYLGWKQMQWLGDVGSVSQAAVT